MNYLQELKSCGDLLYKVNQYWEFVPITKDSNKSLIDTLSNVLNLSQDYIKKHGGAWLVNIKKKSRTPASIISSILDGTITINEYTLNISAEKSSTLNDDIE